MTFWVAYSGALGELDTVGLSGRRLIKSIHGRKEGERGRERDLHSTERTPGGWEGEITGRVGLRVKTPRRKNNVKVLDIDRILHSRGASPGTYLAK
ncbi:hypothetical protein GGI35DRAFT_178352 [Trichoderma velutinum]